MRMRFWEAEVTQPTTSLTTLGLAAPAVPVPPGKVRVKFLKGCVANGTPQAPGTVLDVSAEDAALLHGDGRVALLSDIPRPDRDEEHPFRQAYMRAQRARMHRVRRGLNAISEWALAPLGGKFDIHRW